MWSAEEDGAGIIQAVYSWQTESRGMATTIKAAKKMVEKETAEVWDILAEVIREHPYCLTVHLLCIDLVSRLLSRY